MSALANVAGPLPKATEFVMPVPESQRLWQLANPERIQASRKRWREKNKERIPVLAREWRLKNEAKCREIYRNNYLKNRYGGKITNQKFDEMLASQNGGCAICKSDNPKTKKGWHIDHCHETGTVRGILCHACNIMLGNAKDNPRVLHAAIDYLDEHSARSNSNSTP